jgi:hypothetical protein
LIDSVRHIRLHPAFAPTNAPVAWSVASGGPVVECKAQRPHRFAG